MSDKSTKTIFIDAALETLEETFEKVHGIYLDKTTSIFETLATVSAEEASRPVSSHCASLSAHVAHMAFYNNLHIEYAIGNNPPRADWGEIWRTVREVTPEEWSTSQAELRASYQRLVEIIKSVEQWENEDFIQVVFAVTAHNAYHLGEIRQALCTLKG
jgi:hypothetical protein